MGVNLVTILRNFRIFEVEFTEDSHNEFIHHSLEDECVKPGTHRILSFDFLSHNIGDTDLDIGDPKDHLEPNGPFFFDPGHSHYHLRDFNTYVITNKSTGMSFPGVKQSFCLEDSERISPWARREKRFNASQKACLSNQGISAGWADKYPWWVACQFIVIDELVDGDYTLDATTNAQRVFEEDTFDDNTTRVGLRVKGNNVAVIDEPIILNSQTSEKKKSSKE